MSARGTYIILRGSIETATVRIQNLYAFFAYLLLLLSKLTIATIRGLAKLAEERILADVAEIDEGERRRLLDDGGS